MIRPPADAETERPEHGGDVLVEAFRDLVAAEVLAFAEPRHGDAGEDLAGGAILAPVVEEEILQRQRPAGIAVAQLDGGAEGDQHRRRIADRRAVGDVPADGAGASHLLRAQAAQHLAHIRIDAAERRLGLGVGGGGGDLDPVVHLPHLVQGGDAGRCARCAAARGAAW